MRRLAIEPGVGQHGSYRDSLKGLLERRLKVRIVRSRPSSGDHGQDQMTGTVADDVGIRITRVGRRLIPGFTGSFSSFHKVRTDVTRLETGAIDGRQLHLLPDDLRAHGVIDGFGQQAIRMMRTQQPTGCLVKRREVWDQIQLDGSCQVGRIFQKCRELAIIEPVKLFEYQTREQLRLRELLRTTRVRVRWQPA